MNHMKALFDSWWNPLTRQGDPLRRPNLIGEAFEAGFNAGLREAATIARHACLVAPDGGSPTEAEVDLCDEAARRILARVQ